MTLVVGTNAPGARFLSMLPAIIGIIFVVVVSGALLIRYRKGLFAAQESGTSPVLTLQDLRDMRSRGEMTEAEFERARAVMVAEMKGVRLPAEVRAAAQTEPETDGASERRARPGFDLTGERLPTTGEGLGGFGETSENSGG